VAIIGTILLLRSNAATPYATTDSENAIVAGAASQQTDSNASSGKYVRFGTAATANGGIGIAAMMTADMYRVPASGVPTSGGNQAPTPMNAGFGQAHGARYGLGTSSVTNGTTKELTAWYTLFEQANSQGGVGTNSSPARVQVADTQLWVDDVNLGWIRVQYSQVPQLADYYSAYTTSASDPKAQIPSNQYRFPSAAEGGGVAIHIGEPGLSRAGSTNNVGWTQHSFPQSQVSLASGSPLFSNVRAIASFARVRLDPQTVDPSARYVMVVAADGRANAPTDPPKGDLYIGNGKKVPTDGSWLLVSAADLRTAVHPVTDIHPTGVLSASEYR